MGNMDKLKEYASKRDFKKTPEPAGKSKKKNAKPIWVIQKHDASRLHYDFRLEVDGVLKSWAVPKGPSTDPSEKRLAVPTEDHPLEYASFEGYIPDEEYGGGAVMVWDHGTYRNLKAEGDKPISMEDAYDDGKLLIYLEDGKKLSGGYALFKTGDNWMLVKRKDDEADARRNPVSSEPDSVLTGRSIEKIAEEDKPKEGENG